MGGGQQSPFALWLLRSEVKELVMSVIRGACFCALFSFMFPLVILDGTASTEATLQLRLRHTSAKSHCSGCSLFAQPRGWLCLDHDLVHLPLLSRKQEGAGRGRFLLSPFL